MNGSHKIPGPLEGALGFNVYRVALLFRAELMRALKKYELTPEQWQILVALWSTDGGISQNELSEIVLKDRHTVSRMVTRMERSGWVKRNRHREDDRAVQVFLTKKAKEKAGEIPEKLKSHFKPILGVLSIDEQEGMMRSLKKLRAHLEA